ncbi:amidophosphoribosyltransferase [Coemansia furcata]|uniref:Amidophosphoribosyltransferase n=1 Tax=Coemansia furcata TaxID=417177 RepID=A0ACC1LIZ1_9FUNG|nr:amidophosphoribosyltransferase [Coemansia furcata]
MGDSMDIDVVIPVPDTSRAAALQLSHELGLPYREGFNKNRYVGRTFIMPGQEMRRKNVRRKLNAMPTEFKGLNVLLVDDSIVRGTTSQEIIQMARDVGARKVYFASAAPAIRFRNVYGIDMPSIEELVASGRSDDDVAGAIGADMVFFQELDDLIASCRAFNPRIAAFDTSVFDGKYVTGDVTPEYLHKLEMRRSDASKQKKPADGEVIGLHNYK